MAFVIPTIYTAVDKYSATMRRMTNSTQAFADKAAAVAKRSAVLGLAVLTPIGLAINKAIEFEDKMADIGKTTGLSGLSLQSFGKDLREMSHFTRTSIAGLQDIARIAGEMGIQGRDNLLKFTDSVNKFNVALGSDFQGGTEQAARAIGGLNKLFEQTRSLSIDEAITRTGSAINALTAKGALAPNITDFALRIGALPDAIKPTIQQTVALGAVFDKANIASEIASRAVQDILTTASTNLPAFAKQLQVSQGAVADLLNTDPSAFLTRFATSLKGMDATQFATAAKSLKLGDSGSIKAIGALSSSLDQYNQFLGISNTEYAKGSSLVDEYNAKNNTLAGKIARATNIILDLTITIGEKLIPTISTYIDKIGAAIEPVIDWINKNGDFVKGMLIGAAAIGVLSIATSAIATVITTITYVTKAWTAVQWLLNTALSANPIGLIVIGIAALVAAIVWVAKHTEGWGKQWDATISWIKAVFKGAYLELKIGFQMINIAFWDMVNAVVSAWYWAQNKLGFLSDEQYKKNMAQIAAEKAARVNAFKETASEYQKTMAKVQAGPGWYITTTKGTEAAQGDANSRPVPALMPPNMHAIQFQSAAVQPTKGVLEVQVSAAPGTNAEIKKSSGVAPKVSKTFTNKK